MDIIKIILKHEHNTLCHPNLESNLKEYSEISGRLKHPISPIDRYSLKKLMFKSPVCYEFLLARYAGYHDLCISIEYCTVIPDDQASEIQKCKDLPVLSKLNCFCKSPIEVIEVRLA